MPARYTRELCFLDAIPCFQKVFEINYHTGKMGFNSTELASVFSNLWKRNFLLGFTELPFRLCYLLPVVSDNQENPTPDMADYKSSPKFTGVQNFFQ